MVRELRVVTVDAVDQHGRKCHWQFAEESFRERQVANQSESALSTTADDVLQLVCERTLGP